MFMSMQPNATLVGFSLFCVFCCVHIYWCFFANLLEHKFRSQINAGELICNPVSFESNHYVRFKASKGRLTALCGFSANIKRDDGFSCRETWSWNQRHGSIIHSYYKNTASKDTSQITISEGCAFSTSSPKSQTHRK